MKKIFLFVLFLPIFLCGQTRYTSRFVTGKVLNVTQIAGTASTFDVAVQFIDETGLFTGDNVQVGDFLYMNDGVHGIAFPITAILSPGALNFTVRVQNTIGVASIPTGTGVVTHATPNYDFLPYVSGGFQENQVLLEDFIYRVDSLLGLASVPYTAGTGINITGHVVTNTAPDLVVTITGATGTYPTFALPDASATNELQNLSLTGQALGISSGTGVTLPIVGVASGTGISISTTAGVATVTNTGDLSTTNEIQTLNRNVATNNVVSLSLSGGTANVEDLFVESTASFTPGGTTATMSGTLPSENTKLWVYRNGLPYVVGTNVLRSGSTLTFSRALASGEVVRFKYPFQ